MTRRPRLRLRVDVHLANGIDASSSGRIRPDDKALLVEGLRDALATSIAHLRFLGPKPRFTSASCAT